MTVELPPLIEPDVQFSRIRLSESALIALLHEWAGVRVQPAVAGSVHRP
jgi:hypothetical protein